MGVSTVWIIGAGFSKPLGGLLLNDLFLPRSVEEFHRIYPKDRYGEFASELWRVVRVFNDGRRAHMWQHAEQFVEFVETAESTDGVARQRLLGFLEKGARMGEPGTSLETSPLRGTPTDIKSFASWCRRALAAECGLFLRDANTKYEIWEPYLDWAKRLTGDDTVVSFNYDLVLEYLNKVGSWFRIVVPKADDKGDSYQSVEGGGTAVLKLHGSLDWRILAGHGTIADGDVELALRPSPLQIAMGVPGPGKATFCETLAGPLWEAAEIAIKKAQRIVFLGYRFPETDATARRRLLTAIKQSEVPNELVIEAVLGLPSPDTQRLKLLLVYAHPGLTGDERIHVIPLYAQDYLAVRGILR